MAGRLALVGIVALVFAALYGLGLFDLILEPERVRATVDGLGLWGPVLYVLGFALLEPFFVPGIAFMIPGAMVWGFPESVPPVGRLPHQRSRQAA